MQMLFDDCNKDSDDPLYIKTRDEYHELRAWFETEYIKYKDLIETEFPQRVKLDFLAGFAELYMISVLKGRLLLPLERPKSPEHLDIWVPKHNLRFEVTAPKPGQEGSSNTLPDIPNLNGGKILANEKILSNHSHNKDKCIKTSSNQFLLRLNQSLNTKFEHIKNKIENNKLPLLNDDQSYIVVVYVGCLNSYTNDPTRSHPVLESLFASGLNKISINMATCEVDCFRESRLFNYKELKDGKTVPIKNGLFLDDSNKHISAVIYSSLSPLFINKTRPNNQKLGRDFYLVHNPFAEKPLEEGIIQCGKEVKFVSSVDEENKATLEIRDLKIHRQKRKQFILIIS